MAVRPTETAPPTTIGGEGYRHRQLRVVFSPEPPAARVATLDRAALAIGRDPPAPGLTLPDAQASRCHARVVPSADGWAVVDEGSRNGLFVNGERVERAPLADGAVIRVGGSLLVFVDVTVPPGTSLEPETDSLRGASVAMQRVRGEVAQVAPRDFAVLVTGETGAGKELVAAEIHRLSGRSGRLVSVNCASIGEGVADSELFGHVAGAFTGAAQSSDGLFGNAAGGTLFLDEIGELPAAIQPKLLRALATKEVRPVGGHQARRVDVRLVAATLRDLGAEVAGGGFREDLLARLSSWTITVPPLRARRDDILRLAAVFLERAGGTRTFAVRAAEALLLYDWPYNVRQLQQVIVAATVKAGADDVIRRSHLPHEIAASTPFEPGEAAAPADPPLALAVDRDATPGKRELCLVLEQLGGNLTRVAEFFGKERPQIYRWLQRHGIDAESYRKR